MITTKEKVKIIALSLVKKDKFYWHAYKIKNFIVKNFQIKQETIYVSLRELQEEKLLNSKIIYNENLNKEQKKFEITKLGEEKLINFEFEIKQYQKLLKNLENKEIYDYE